MNYNTSVELWAATRETYKERKTHLRVVDGHIFVNRDGYVARFTNNDEAKKTLFNAGYHQTDVESDIFYP